MKPLIAVANCLCFLTALGVQGQPTKIPHESHSGYFVSNKVKFKGDARFFVIKDSAQFKKIFGTAFVMGDRANRLKPGAFRTKMVLALAKRGKGLWQFKVSGVTAKGKILSIRYAAKMNRRGAATFVSPLIVSIPRGDYTNVEFYENKKRVAIVTIGK